MDKRQNDATAGLPTMREESAEMRYFELMEAGLPSESFLVQPPVAALPNTVMPRRRVRFRIDSPWRNNRKAGEKLTWRGRSFVEAFAEVNRRQIVRATLMDLPVGGGHVAVEGWRPGPTNVERYHFICETSEGAYIRVGEERITPKPGELWRIDDRFHPAIIRGGLAGSVHLVLELTPLHAVAAVEKNDIYETSRISDDLQRSQSVG
ncbi:MAG: hypothetical protein ABMA14_17385 [Hyphomonadaceae bacterium]